ncbi:BsuPI-related putative proteinase inhibitor [Thermaerobacillus caldiproteolyticus]|uniref:Intracellular proteinase inhibitor BsuPI domain-containing protein n=1 Tax=Thermaerobacillus caldiproteolyticus TaxID=247480 RepID=A0A7V9Z5S0_9BACL|nr:BsuPI-related putative proteinase inhibitor [Anoxybacillus caldiproteolyticus]MBA2874501.1 hypothetical protein [Anoxybacillus caldiproteolyticus]QPA33298.1 proteinase inhibitor [Anoxybacillus caldiproteolyticus]
MGKGRIIGWLGLFAGLAAVGVFFTSNSMMKSEAKDTPPQKQPQHHHGGIVAGTLQPSLVYEKKNNRYVFTFMVKNQTERVQKITFTSGKKYDYILYRDGKKVKQFSEGKAFIQIYEERPLKQGEELVFTETFESLPKGHYTLEWWLADPNWPNAKAKVTFTVE